MLVLCDIVGAEGGTESMLSRVLPEIVRSGIALTIRGRRVLDPVAFGPVAAEIAWGSDEQPSSPSAAREVERLIADTRPDMVLLSNVFDTGVMRAARGAARAFVRLHDHRTFCPNGDRIYPQFRAPCSVAMGGACLINAVVHGCVRGVHPQTVRRLRAREQLAEAVAALDGIIVSSEFMAGLCVTNGIERERILIARPPVDPRSLETPPLPMPAQRRILFAGRLLPDKGLGSLVRALARIRPAERPGLDVAGAATRELEEIKALAAGRGVDLIHLGRLGPAAMERAIDATRAVAVPSLWPEPFGLLGVEAQARGRPAVAYAVGGIPEWIGAAGIAVPRGDEAALARAIVEVTDDERWKEYALIARQQAAGSTAAGHVARILEFCFSSVQGGTSFASS